jgi:hypothetical protein
VNDVSIFISGYNRTNLQISKEKSILGWVQRKKELKIGDYVFIYNIDEKTIESLFEIESVSENQDPIWQDEQTTGLTKYKNRWDVKLIRDNLNISIEKIIKFNPFNGSIRNFNLIIRNPFPTLLNDKFTDLRGLLLKNSGLQDLVEKQDSESIAENLRDKNIQYFLIQVSEFGSKNLVENSFYQHVNWKDTPRDIDHGKVNKGDILLIYFARNSIKYRM